ncbi:MAG: M28 family peptidase [Bacteroidetes bacterium]|nr:M28 family peptidase [Bacteroidota bacterium]
MNTRFFLLVAALQLFVLNIQLSNAQDIQYAHTIIEELCSPTYYGRGYVNNGANLAADFLEKEFHDIKLKKFGNSYIQQYSFGVNTHPGQIQCKLDKKPMQVGIDFLVSAGATSFQGTCKLLHFNTRDSNDISLLHKKIEKGFDEKDALVLHYSGQRGNRFVDSCKAYQHMPKLIIFTEEKKLTHTIATKTDDYNSLVFIDSAIRNTEAIDIQFTNEWQPNLENRNVIGYVKGKRNDSCIVFSAHYDHLGMQGNAQFPGANDNASGSSMILYLARYFSKHKPNRNIIFILFSGEEAGLLGSKYFTSHPTFDIAKIKMLVNIDIMGSAEKGITVVNGETFRKQFDLLRSINDKDSLIPEVKIRGKTKNSDHYYFSEMGIPSFFIYSMGGPGYYHDIFDKAASVSLTNYEQVAKLLIDFVAALK